MTSTDTHKTKVAAVFNRCTETTIPFENFLKVNTDKFEKHVLSFYQSNEDLESYSLSPDLRERAVFHGLKAKDPMLLIAFFRLLMMFFKLRPEVVHVHHNISGFLAAMAGWPYRKTKTIVTIHNNFNFFNKRQKIIFFLTYLLSDLIVCNSCNTRDSIRMRQKRFFPKTRTLVIYNGVDTEKVKRVHNIESFAETRGRYMIGIVGRLVPQKDHKTLIEAFARFHKQVKESLLIIAGEGPLRQELRQLTQKLQIEKDVLFYGLLSREKVYEILGRFNLFVVSSKWEGFCNAMVEAMVAGVPVLASDVEPLPEVLGTDHGTFFNVGDVNDLSDKMLHCYSRPKEIAKLAERAKNYADERYSIEKSVMSYENVYETIAHR